MENTMELYDKAKRAVTWLREYSGQALPYRGDGTWGVQVGRASITASPFLGYSDVSTVYKTHEEMISMAEGYGWEDNPTQKV